ncbi:hypothetical protein CANCADRAFT_30547 [Tortispora caseinolytica NRRL Y-17796]|uniref:Uncharacterized protein n=1 Tax=Tortispora caseinolytica NRRL Y-17796 TaxID=767744 RepID=A0A1E4TKT3_9ASCO|nr:hypothetical protein CANCADRAFT_30547 [Tortispora caseinolytica NRRL Y-17796]
MCRLHLPPWLNITLYILSEIAIIATDLAEVIGTAIALNILFHIPLPAGVAITILDVLLVMFAYRPNGTMKAVRYFEIAVASLVFAVVICFCIELANLPPTSAGEVFLGFVPSKELLQKNGLIQACGILGATVMPHSLFLGSGIVQPRLQEYDISHGYWSRPTDDNDQEEFLKYRPTLQAIRSSLKFTIIELTVSLLTFAMFVNAAILILAGATLYKEADAETADLFAIYNLLSKLVSPAAGTIFAVALLFSGFSAGIVCTIAGQMVCEGFIRWTIQPWLRRLVTRLIAILPCLVIACSLGRDGMAVALTASQVILSVLLPFVSAPLIYFTSRKKLMRVAISNERVIADEMEDEEAMPLTTSYLDYSSNTIVIVIGALLWLFVSVLNIALLVLTFKGLA